MLEEIEDIKQPQKSTI